MKFTAYKISLTLTGENGITKEVGRCTTEKPNEETIVRFMSDAISQTRREFGNYSASRIIGYPEEINISMMHLEIKEQDFDFFEDILPDNLEVL